MLKAIYLAGVPASGKTTIMREVRNRMMSSAVPFERGTLHGVMAGNVFAYGVFDGSLFEGTDRLSMCVIDDAIAHVKELQGGADRHVLFVEGDRLFCERFLRAASATVIVIDAAKQVLCNRHKLRRDRQTSTRLKACRTKIENFCSRHKVIRVFNNTPGDLSRIVGEIVRIATEYMNEPISKRDKRG